jgi:hypothetical protein
MATDDNGWQLTLATDTVIAAGERQFRAKPLQLPGL